VSAEPAAPVGLGLVARIEEHSVLAWPPGSVQRTEDGWILRATPALPARGRSNHALTPARPLDRSEFDPAIARVAEFAALNDIACGVQVSPIDLHIPLLEDIAVRGWDINQAVLVMTVETGPLVADADPAFQLEITDNATPEWVAAWAHCDRRQDVQEHLQSVFPKMTGRARFARNRDRAVGISVELDGIVGLFCLAVAPEARRQGLGKALVRAMLAQHEAPLAYLQVFSENAAGHGLYSSLGFHEEYRYCHCVAPWTVPGDAVAGSVPTGGC
jgi:N-acetylglutamate synthase